MADGFRHTVAALKGGPMLHPPPTVTKPPPVGATAVPTFGNTYSKGYSCTGFSFGTSIPVGFNEQRFRPGVRWSFGPIGSNDRQHDGAFGTQQARGFSDGNVYGSGARSESRGGWFGSSTTVSMGFNRIAYHGPFGASAFTSRPLGLNFKASPWPPGAPRSGESSTISFFPSAGAAGTSHPPYQQTVVGSQDIPVDMLLHSITGMDAYRGFSVEELRLQDYRRKHPC
ncbi:hypothetical protein BD410DRAFT_836470 [Rickenella mellea]|uniref:Uncharacterized protein n=1 Tax=Rickenella mellea TaxID=50990 RepID=A0A4Y7QGR0_9AGAM|nr:hypothetical protein BD410DRAFT_836470 [Rickenella mellea]